MIHKVRSELIKKVNGVVIQLKEAERILEKRHKFDVEKILSEKLKVTLLNMEEAMIFVRQDYNEILNTLRVEILGDEQIQREQRHIMDAIINNLNSYQKTIELIEQQMGYLKQSLNSDKFMKIIIFTGTVSALTNLFFSILEFDESDSEDENETGVSWLYDDEKGMIYSSASSGEGQGMGSYESEYEVSFAPSRGAMLYDTREPTGPLRITIPPRPANLRIEQVEEIESPVDIPMDTPITASGAPAPGALQPLVEDTFFGSLFSGGASE